MLALFYILMIVISLHHIVINTDAVVLLFLSSLLFVSELYSSNLIQELLEHALGGGAASGYRWFSSFTLKRHSGSLLLSLRWCHFHI